MYRHIFNPAATCLYYSSYFYNYRCGINFYAISGNFITIKWYPTGNSLVFASLKTLVCKTRRCWLNLPKFTPINHDINRIGGAIYLHRWLLHLDDWRYREFCELLILKFCLSFLAHLSETQGELIVYHFVRRPSVRPQLLKQLLL